MRPSWASENRSWGGQGAPARRREEPDQRRAEGGQDRGGPPLAHATERAWPAARRIAPLKAARPLRRLCCGPRPSAGRGPRRRAAAAARRLVAEGERAGQQHVVLRRRLLPQESPQPAEHSAAGTLLVGARRGVGRRGVVEAATCHGAEGGGLRSGAEREPLWPLAVCEVDSQPSDQPEGGGSQGGGRARQVAAAIEAAKKAKAEATASG